MGRKARVIQDFPLKAPSLPAKARHWSCVPIQVLNPLKSAFLLRKYYNRWGPVSLLQLEFRNVTLFLAQGDSEETAFASSVSIPQSRRVWSCTMEGKQSVDFYWKNNEIPWINSTFVLVISLNMLLIVGCTDLKIGAHENLMGVMPFSLTVPSTTWQKAQLIVCYGFLFLILTCQTVLPETHSAVNELQYELIPVNIGTHSNCSFRNLWKWKRNWKCQTNSLFLNLTSYVQIFS